MATDKHKEAEGLTAERLWAQTTLSAIVRAILYADHPAYRLMGVRKFSPILTREQEQTFLSIARNHFFQGLSFDL